MRSLLTVLRFCIHLLPRRWASSSMLVLVSGRFGAIVRGGNVLPMAGFVAAFEVGGPPGDKLVLIVFYDLAFVRR